METLLATLILLITLFSLLYLTGKICLHFDGVEHSTLTQCLKYGTTIWTVSVLMCTVAVLVLWTIGWSISVLL